MSVTEEQLSAYADGMLAAEDEARVAAAVNADPALQRRVERMRGAAAALRGAFDGVLSEPTPARLAAVLDAPQPTRGQVIAFPHLRRPEIWAAAAAACFAVAFLGGRASVPNDPFVVTNGRVIAAGALERALNTQASGGQGEVQIALSFASEDGGHCRAFRLEGDAASAGLACGEREDWTIVALADAAPMRAGDGYSQAAGAVPAAILDAVAARRGGDPLDADAEAAAIRDGWR